VLYFTSDHHFWHTNIIRYCNRPFGSVEEMNEVLIQKWNDLVGPEDEVYYLGDFSVAARPVEVYTTRLNGIKFLIPGNHDFCHSYHKRSRTPEHHARWIQQYQDWGWTVLPEQMLLMIPDLGEVKLCHLPYNMNFEGDKYAKWRPHDDGHWLLCGHVHDKWITMHKMINVGVDAWNLQPISVIEITEIIQKEYNAPRCPRHDL
jgi:calcineurin-like phosphoesterase family protein